MSKPQRHDKQKIKFIEIIRTKTLKFSAKQIIKNG